MLTIFKELNIAQRVINKKYENTRSKGTPRKGWIDGILEAVGNITAKRPTEEDRKLSLPLTLRGN
jgi:hypothetical protein